MGIHYRGRRFLYTEPYKIGMGSVRTDFLISPHRWSQFIAGVRSDWAESVLYVSIAHLLDCGVTDVSNSNRALCC